MIVGNTIVVVADLLPTDPDCQRTVRIIVDRGTRDKLDPGVSALDVVGQTICNCNAGSQLDVENTCLFVFRSRLISLIHCKDKATSERKLFEQGIIQSEEFNASRVYDIGYNDRNSAIDMTAKEFEEAAGMSVEDYVKTNYYDIQVLRDKVLEFVVDNAKLK